MPLRHLIDTFNDRFIAEHQLKTAPLSYDGSQVHGRYGNLTFSSDLKPIRQLTHPDLIIGHDTSPLVFKVGRSPDSPRLLQSEPLTDIVCLDRLGRTVHMLNYLSLDPAQGFLFLHVHPQHVLTVKKDHGAYFEDIIRRCGLPLQRIAITLTLNPVYESQQALLLERLKNYRDRGYATSVKFDELAGGEFVERFRAQFLHRLTPDFVRFNARFFLRAFQERGGERRRDALFRAIRLADTQILVDRIGTATEAGLAALIRADHVQGDWYEDRAPLAKVV
jgi:EAL domain-containing protein (putative c-di-GMP-specific phosphodiesterase class I)